MNETIKSLIAGALGSFSSLLVGYPFETIKIRMQYKKSLNYKLHKNMDINMYKNMYKNMDRNMYKNMYKGFYYPFLSVIPVSSLTFLIFDTIREKKTFKNTLVNTCFSSCISSTLTLPITIPIEFNKCNAQVNNNYNIINKIKKDGFLSLYKGSYLTFVRFVPGYIIYFTSYQYWKDKMPMENKYSIFAGACTGITVWTLILPIDIIKNRIQTGVNSNFRECCYNIYSKYGLIGFYKGFTPAIIRCIPTNAAYFYVIETIKSY